MKTIASDKHKITMAFTLLLVFLCYTFYLYFSLPVKNKSLSTKADKGKLIWQQYNCNACHQVYGLGGYLGPDLTNVYSIKGKDYIKAFLNYGSTTMPDFHLTEQEKDALMEYFKNTDASGNSDPRSFTIKYDGTITQ